MLAESLNKKLIDLCRRLLDQTGARTIVPPYAASSGYWFGGGNLTIGPDGHWYLVGRYRNEGDSRTGLAAGSRGLELAIYRSTDAGNPFEKVVSFAKEDLNTSQGKVLSIEGTALRWEANRVELFVSTEKEGRSYPGGYRSYLKPGTGIWSIDRIAGSSVRELADAPVEPLLSSDEPSTIHVKDPFVYESEAGPLLLFCSHPFSWTCSNTGYGRLADGMDGQRICEQLNYDFFPRGNVWDVAISRGTAVMRVPPVGAFEGRNVQLMFYDGGECVRDLDQHTAAVSRPRGYSCEELGGVAVIENEMFADAMRLSAYEPLFVSPHGTGCSRYVDVLATPDELVATWQQSQPDGSQPLVMNVVSNDEVQRLLS